MRHQWLARARRHALASVGWFACHCAVPPPLPLPTPLLASSHGGGTPHHRRAFHQLLLREARESLSASGKREGGMARGEPAAEAEGVQTPNARPPRFYTSGHTTKPSAMDRALRMARSWCHHADVHTLMNDDAIDYNGRMVSISTVLGCCCSSLHVVGPSHSLGARF